MPRVNSILSRLPSFYQSKEWENVLHRFASVFGAMADGAEEDLIRVMRSHWVNSADNAPGEGRGLEARGDLDKVLGLYVEALGGTSLLKQRNRREGADGLQDDAIYRNRIKGLIQVLRSGASTKEGIMAIVAANLGIVGEGEEVEKARNSIRIEEFLPQAAPPQIFPAAIFQEFIVQNPNPVDSTPAYRIEMLPTLGVPLINPGIRNLSNGGFVQFSGTLVLGDLLSFFPDGTATLNGQPAAISGAIPPLLPGSNQVRIEGKVGFPQGRFDETAFDISFFDEASVRVFARFDEPDTVFDTAAFASTDPAVNVTVQATKLTPGAFTVRIPWDIPGFTEQLDELADKPREQIKGIVEKVKAAGVLSVIAYEKYFTEDHEIETSLGLKAQWLPEDQEMEEIDFNIGSNYQPYPGGINHEMTDSLTLSGVFDRTGFDSLNTFA